MVKSPRFSPLFIFVLTVLGIIISFQSEIDINVLGLNFKRDIGLKKGLDLAGGTHLVLQADMEKLNPADRDAALESLQSIIDRRVNLYGVSEALTQAAKVNSDYRIIVELPGIKDLDQATELVGKTAQLTFRETLPASEAGKIATTAATLFGPFQQATELSGQDLARASATFNQNTGEPTVGLTFTPEGAKKFEAITQRNLNKQLAIFLDDKLLMAPTVQTIISGGQAVITGQFTSQETKEFAILLNSGALPAPVKIIEQKTIGATLGQDSINKSLLAGTIGLVVVAVFMVVNYGKLGLVADLALLSYVVFSLAIFKLLPVTMTLAGITGFILSVGMAVDANILIFERMKEELRWGKNQVAAVELGFARALPSIRDSNVSSFITCAILFWFGTGAVRGFALTLAIGIGVSLFTAINVTRTYLRLLKHG